jgi:hypothetical protein
LTDSLNDSFSAYLAEIGMNDLLMERVSTLRDLYAAIQVEELSDIFVNETLTAEGDPIFDSVWFFTSSYAMESLLSGDTFDSVRIDRIVRWEITLSDYDWKEANESSRLSISLTFPEGITGSLRATHKNCDYLRDLFVRWIVPKT